MQIRIITNLVVCVYLCLIFIEDNAFSSMISVNEVTGEFDPPSFVFKTGITSTRNDTTRLRSVCSSWNILIETKILELGRNAIPFDSF